MSEMRMTEKEPSPMRGEPLSEYSKKQAVYRMVDGGWSHRKIARKTNIQRETIARWVFERKAMAIDPLIGNGISAMTRKEWRAFKAHFNMVKMALDLASAFKASGETKESWGMEDEYND